MQFAKTCLAYLAFFFAIAAAGAALAQEFTAGSIVVQQPWSRATPGGAKIAVGYLTITNRGREPDRLVGGTFAYAERVELHEMRMDGGVMKMRSLPNGLAIKPGETVKLEPNGYHIMFVGLKEPLKQGDTLKGQLRFEKAGTLDVDVAVQSMGASGPAPAGHQHQH